MKPIYAAAIQRAAQKVTPMAVAPLRFTNTGDGEATVAFNDVKYNRTRLQYRKNEGKRFGEWDLSAVTLQPGEYMEVVGDTTAATKFIGRFVMTGTIAASGSVMSIVYGESITVEQNLIMPYDKLSFTQGSLDSIFNGCTSLITAPELPATTLVEYCYYYMFKGCTSLTTAPELSATTLVAYCYADMFKGCTSLTTAPELPATTLAERCYYEMFSDCTSLTTAPELPATTLAERCYYYMFSGCTSLTTASELPAMTLAEKCYEGMFKRCFALTTAPELPATTLAEYCYYYMFDFCTSLTTAPELSATTLAESCYAGMFNNCTSLTTAPELPATTLAESCYVSMFEGCNGLNEVTVGFDVWGDDNATSNWLNGVAADGTFKCPAGLDTTTRDASHVPEDWTVETV